MAPFCFTKSKSSLAKFNVKKLLTLPGKMTTKEEFVEVCFDVKCMSYISILRPETY